jgi:hypothetical protein
MLEDAPMTCLEQNPRGADLLLGLFEGTLAAQDRQALAEHCATCAPCAALLNVPTEMVEYAPAVSLDFDNKLRARIAADAERRPWSFALGWKSWKLWVPALASMLAVAIFVSRADDAAGQQKAANVATKQVATGSDIQQLEQALEDLELLKAEAL